MSPKIKELRKNNKEICKLIKYIIHYFISEIIEKNI